MNDDFSKGDVERLRYCGLLVGFNLEAFDVWLAEPSWRRSNRSLANLQRLQELRARAAHCAAVGNWEALDAWCHAMQTQRTAMLLIERLLPMARAGAGVDGRRKLPCDDVLLAELEELRRTRSEKDARSVLYQRHNYCTSRALRRRLKKAERSAQ